MNAKLTKSTYSSPTKLSQRDRFFTIIISSQISFCLKTPPSIVIIPRQANSLATANANRYLATANMRVNILWVMARLRKCSLFYLGILLWFWRWEGFPYRIQYHHQESGWAGIPVDNRMTLILSLQRLELSLRAQRLLCNGPAISQHKETVNR